MGCPTVTVGLNCAWSESHKSRRPDQGGQPTNELVLAGWWESVEDVGQGYVTVGATTRFLNVSGGLTCEDRARRVEQFPATIATTNPIRKHATTASTDLQWRAILVVCLMEGKEPPGLARGHQQALNKLDLTRGITYHNPLLTLRKALL